MASSTQPDLSRIHRDLYTLAIEAGRKITSSVPTTIDTKVNSSDLVTETDKAVEELVSRTLKEKYPDYGFLGEETSKSGTLPPTATFVCDPIDGTTNFIHRFPYISISLAFCLDRRPLVGVVYNPYTQQLFHAIKGRGAFLTAPSIPSSAPPLPGDFTAPGSETKVESTYTTHPLPLSRPGPLGPLNKCLVAVEWGNERDIRPNSPSTHTNFPTKTSTFTSLASSTGGFVHSLRSLGSAALNLCHVATGQLDAYWEGGCWAWDVAAGWIILEEAGGVVVGGNKGEWGGEWVREAGKEKDVVQVDGRRYLAVRAASSGDGGKEEQKKLIEEFWGLIEGELRYS